MKPSVWIPGVAALSLGAVACAAANICLDMICLPACHDEAHERQRENNHGFGDVLDLWDNVWRRESFSLPSGNIIIQGEIIRNPDPAPGRTRVAVVCHGQTANRIACLKYAKIFLEEGFHVVVFDERHFGASTGRCCMLGQEESHDIARVMNFTRETFGKDCILALHGESMGAASSILALQYAPADFAVEDCPFANTLEMTRVQMKTMAHLPEFPVLPLAGQFGKLRFGYNLWKVNPIEAVRQTETPICFMHGDNDHLIDCCHSKEMYAVCRNPLSELHLFSGSGHAGSIVKHREEYESIMKAFIEKCLAAIEEDA